MHTPGPWACQPIGDETECNILGAGRELIATVSDNDARLIAAAPRMLAWIKRAAYWAGELENSPKSFAARMQAQMDEARAILRDVEGESNG